VSLGRQYGAVNSGLLRTGVGIRHVTGGIKKMLGTVLQVSRQQRTCTHAAVARFGPPLTARRLFAWWRPSESRTAMKGTRQPDQTAQHCIRPSQHSLWQCFDWAAPCAHPQVDQNNYPEMLGKTAIINAGAVINFVFPFVKPFLDKRTVNKIEVRPS
jgi:CRAL/TRIO domain